MRLSLLARALTVTTAALVISACGDDNDSNVNTTVSDVTPPLLTTTSDFSDGMIATAALMLSGQLQDTGGIKSFTYQINDEPAQALTVDADGMFTNSILLDLGSNKLTLVATDTAGNTTKSTKTIYLGDKIAAGGAHTGALKDGQLYGWGRNNSGQTGLGMTSKFSDVNVHPATPMLMKLAPNNLTTISFNQNHSLAINQDGQVYSWGDDRFGQLGRGDTGRSDCNSKADDCRLDIDTISGIDNAVMVSAGYKHNLVLTKDGTVWAMGSNGQGQLGNGNNNSTDSDTPVKVDFSAATDIGHIVQVAASANSSYALDDKGQVWGWGSDGYANLGKGQQCNSDNNCININASPTLINIIPASSDNTVNNPERVTQLAAGRDHVLALTNKESVYGWGLNASSQVGYNGEKSADNDNAWDDVITKPTKLTWFIDKEVRRVYANGNSSYVLLDDGKVYPWGMFGETNSEGKTVYNDLDEPTNTLPSLTNIENIGMGALHLIAQDKADRLYTWGWSFEGSIGSQLATNIWMYNVPFSISLPDQ